MDCLFATFVKIVFAFLNKQIVTVVVSNKQQAINMYATHLLATCFQITEKLLLPIKIFQLKISNDVWEFSHKNLDNEESARWHLYLFQKIFNHSYSDCKRSPLYSTDCKNPLFVTCNVWSMYRECSIKWIFFLVELH